MTDTYVQILDNKLEPDTSKEQFMLGPLSAEQVAVLFHKISIANAVIIINMRGGINAEDDLKLQHSLSVFLDFPPEHTAKLLYDTKRVNDVVFKGCDVVRELFKF